MPALRNVYDLRPQIEENGTRQRENFPEIRGEEFWELYDLAKPYSMLAITGFYNLYQSVRYLAANEIPGDFVECGALFGGACIFIGLLRQRLGLRDRTIHVFDTFAGFPPGSEDVGRGGPTKGPSYESFYEPVVANFEATCGTDGVEFHVGDVAETLPRFRARPLALMRLDTDYYVSTKVELELLYPMLTSGGVMIIDDYGYYEGSRRATDEYLDGWRDRPLLNRIDSAVWAGAKP